MSTSTPTMPPPWTLKGHGYVLFFRQKGDFYSSEEAVHASKRPSLDISTLMLVDYQKSEAGPYRELLFIPGLYRRGWQYYPSISHIFVTTKTSVLSGRKNWGIPKQLASIQTSTQANKETFNINQNGLTVAEITLESGGPTLPFSTMLIPPMFRTFFQELEGHHFKTKIKGTGRLQLARVDRLKTPGRLFPNLGRCLLAFKVSDFVLHFPAPLMKVPIKEQ